MRVNIWNTRLAASVKSKDLHFHFSVEYPASMTNSPCGCWTKNRGSFTPKMDGENNGKPYEQMDDLGGFHPYFWKHPI